VWQITHLDDRETGRQSMARLLAGDAQAYRVERRYLHADGSTVWASVDVSLVRDEAGAPMHFIQQVQDISEQKEIEARLTYQALHDPLTGLGNRTLLLDRLEHALAQQQRREDTLVALLFLDLDRFKVVNDTHGHDVGDRLLVQVAYRLREILRPGDTAVRLGGDEFVILCEAIPDRRAGAAVAKRVERELARPFSVSSIELSVSASIGVVFAHGDEDDAEALLRDADSAMYRAKNRGRARVEVGGSQHADSPARLQLERDLRRAVDEDQLAVVYQPILELRNGHVVSVEALLRWQHPALGLLTPDSFLDVAEDSGLIVPMGLWILEQACRQAVSWNAGRPAGDPVSVSVNLSARQLSRPDAPECIAQILSVTALPSSCLQLEVTESVLLETAAATPAEFSALKELGVSLGVDNFGTGISSVVSLGRYPLDFLKVDRSFVGGLGRDGGDAAIVDAILALGRALGLVTVAEGAETAVQAERLRGMGCDRVQGYYICPPRPAGELADLLPVAA
jgi:diguanylate cyclase (GGDEF)-like protein